MNQVLKSIDYKGVFSYFEEICDVPRGSKHNTKISEFLVEFAKKNKLEYRQDEFENVIIVKEASKGYEQCPTLIIQGHMDMVCEKESNIEHDFLTEPLDLYVEGDFIRARGTTLGGDDGIAIAYAMAVLTDESIIHPRLEIIITTDEEVGMDGAFGLDTSDLKGKHMLNIDSEEEGILLSSSAGGLTGTCELPLEWEDKSGQEVMIKIAGLFGGHSGTEINKNRTNATKLLGRLLFEIKESVSFDLIHIMGGLKDNAIPREAETRILVDNKKTEEVKTIVSLYAERYKSEFKTSEPGLTIEVILKDQIDTKVLKEERKDAIIFQLVNAPDGVQVMSADINNLVESSLNLGICKMDTEKAYFYYSVRSSVNSYKHFLSNKLKMISEYLGGSYYVRGEYEAWEYRKDSELRDILVKAYKNQYGEEPKVEAIHAGLECGVLAGKIKDLDIVSFGPNMLDIHTPQERMSISSAIRVYDYIVSILKDFCIYYE